MLEEVMQSQPSLHTSGLMCHLGVLSKGRCDTVDFLFHLFNTLVHFEMLESSSILRIRFGDGCCLCAVLVSFLWASGGSLYQLDALLA